MTNELSSAVDNLKLAVLIDADNAPSSRCGELLAEVSTFGLASIKRAYGDWTTTHLKGWKRALHDHAIQPIQQFAYTTGKNATDAALIIDAMDLLHQAHLDGFVIVSSDSDYTRLATRIRESGLAVYGFGEKKTPPAFVSACDRFVFTEILAAEPSRDEPAPTGDPKELRRMLTTAIEAVSRDDGWAPLGAVGSYVNKNHPSFDSRNYGFSKLSKLMESLDYVTLDFRESRSDADTHIVYVRLK
ncbi:NYN domain-containing protein [Salinisphaera sp. RV14]|uniref:NYN domain-containing protein n=1 Tax=Salinisphaera sp. RV14 TaxID=3454140 RepID=UPI003F87417C